jgi:two-component system phosphate regulon sensor histidine kinase PhoR
VSWVHSRLFWKITGVYTLLSTFALIGLLLMLDQQVQEHSLGRQHRWIEDSLRTIARELSSGLQPKQVMDAWRGLLKFHAAELWIVDESLNPLTDSSSELPQDITLQSVVQAAVTHERTTRSIRLKLADGVVRDYLAFAEVVTQPSGNGRSLLLVLVQPGAFQREVNSTRLILLQTALFTWLIGIFASGFVAAGIVAPLQSMSKNLRHATNPEEREDMLLTISDRQDELGRVASSLHELEEERQEQITQLQSAERIARSSAELLTTVLDSMIEGVIAIDAEQRITFLNTAARDLLIISPVIGPGRRLYEAVRAGAFLETVQETLSKRQVQSLEFRIPADQKDLVVASIPIPEGPHSGAVIVVRDISESRRLESMRRDFVSGVSHELKTPLTVIQACTDTLLGGAMSDPEAAERFLKQIDEQSERLLGLILSMLQLARVESGQLVVNIVPVALDYAIANVQRSFQTVAESRGVQLIRAGLEDMVVQTDHQAVQTILSNLVDNALKHTDAGGRVTILVERCDTSTDLIVRDTGTGIPEELLGRIFERFYRVEQDRSRERGGSGLGLAIVRHLCQALGVQIVVKSKPGVGSEFRVQFPG